MGRLEIKYAPAHSNTNTDGFAIVMWVFAILLSSGTKDQTQSNTAFTDYFRDGPVDKVWGLGNVPLTFAPQVSDPSELAFVKQEKPDAPDLVACILRKEPARQLVNLKGIPILILTSEAGFHATSDHCNALFLKQAGVDNDFLRLPDIGIHGNSHYLMLEKNSIQIAGVVADWLGKSVTPAETKEMTTGR